MELTVSLEQILYTISKKINELEIDLDTLMIKRRRLMALDTVVSKEKIKRTSTLVQEIDINVTRIRKEIQRYKTTKDVIEDIFEDEDLKEWI